MYRFFDPTEASADEVEAILARGGEPIIQFSRPASDPDLLPAINQLCARFGDRLQIRFYAFNGQVFDAALLEALPDVANLSLDTLTAIRNEDQVARLTGLTRLRFGAWLFDRPDFLAVLPLEQLTHLAVLDSRRRNLNLAPLVRCERLEELSLIGHSRGVEAITALPRLTSLWLGSTPKQQPLAFVGQCDALRMLKVAFGSRTSLDFAHPRLETLDILRVRGLETLGPLGRFPSLWKLHVEDQLQLSSIDAAGAPLEDLAIATCKTLEAIHGLDQLERLQRLRVAETRLDLDALLERDWPASMQAISLYSGSLRWNEAARARLNARGYREA